MANPHIIVLAGGLGTRIRPALGDLPKVLAPVSGRPFIQHLLSQLSNAGDAPITFAIGHGADQVESHLAHISRSSNRTLNTAVETLPLGTAGAVRNALAQTSGTPIMVLNGDSYIDCDFTALWAFHADKHAKATMLAAHVDDAGRYGTVTVAADGQVTSFAEKSGNAGESAWINSGVYIFERSVLEQIPEGKACSLEYGILPSLCGLGLYANQQHARFIDIGTPESLAAAEVFFDHDRTGFKDDH